MTTIADPRTPAPGASAWLTNSRVYNLIWLGRWLERVESLVRAIDAAALAAAESGGRTDAPLRAVAEAWGVPAAEGESPLPALRAAVRDGVERARDNAHQIAPLQFIQSVNGLLERLDASVEADNNAGAGAPDDASVEADDAPASLRAFAEDVLEGVSEASAVIERAWFNRQGLTDEEVMQRFAQ